MTIGANRRLTAETPISRHLPYARHLDDVTIETRDGLLVQILQLRASRSRPREDDELNYRKRFARRCCAARPTRGWRSITTSSAGRVEPAWPDAPEDPFCARLDHDWRGRLAERRLFVNELYLTLVRRPLQGQAGVLEQAVPRRRAARPPAATTCAQLDAVREVVPGGARALRPAHARPRRRRRRPPLVGAVRVPRLILASGSSRRMLAPGGEIADALADRRLLLRLRRHGIRRRRPRSGQGRPPWSR